jgi:hypothetical protein
MAISRQRKIPSVDILGVTVAQLAKSLVGTWESQVFRTSTRVGSIFIGSPPLIIKKSRPACSQACGSWNVVDVQWGEFGNRHKIGQRTDRVTG